MEQRCRRKKSGFFAKPTYRRQVDESESPLWDDETEIPRKDDLTLQGCSAEIAEVRLAEETFALQLYALMVSEACSSTS